MERGVERYYERIAPLLESPKLGPVVWQLPANFHRDDERLGPRSSRCRRAATASSSATRAGSRPRCTSCCARTASRSYRRRPASGRADARADRRLDASCASTTAHAAGAATTRARSCATWARRIAQLAPAGRGLRLLQQRLGGLRAQQRVDPGAIAGGRVEGVGAAASRARRCRPGPCAVAPGLGVGRDAVVLARVGRTGVVGGEDEVGAGPDERLQVGRQGGRRGNRVGRGRRRSGGRRRCRPSRRRARCCRTT